MSPGTTGRPGVDLLLKALDQAYDRTSWHGPVLRGTLRGVSAGQAAWRPAPARHNVWELAVHAAYWKYSVVRRLCRRRSEDARFPLAGSNWFPRPIGEPGQTGEPDERAWKADLQVLADMHRSLRAEVARLTDADLAEVPAGSRTAIGNLVLGVAYHDVYHAGQIQLLKRLWPNG
ncbi:MAG TPA: DinB family protein [Thermoanaerobaculia bacterium]|nr:DinB family protein [Thermoanaerobaculia bacterium]